MRITMVAAALLVLCAQAALAQPYVLQFGPANERVAGMAVSVWDPTGETCTPPTTLGGNPECTSGAYVVMTLRTLLYGLVTFPDTLIRYAGLIEWVDGTPTLTAADFDTAIAGAPGSKVIQLPPTPIGASLVRIIFAIPVDADDPEFIAAGPGNSGLNSVAGYAKQDTTVMLGSPAVAYNAWYRTYSAFPLSFTQYLFLDITAQP